MTVTSCLKSSLLGTVSICWDIGRGGQGVITHFTRHNRGPRRAEESRGEQEERAGWMMVRRGNMWAGWCMICVTLHYQHTLPTSGQTISWPMITSRKLSDEGITFNTKECDLIVVLYSLLVLVLIPELWIYISMYLCVFEVLSFRVFIVNIDYWPCLVSCERWYLWWWPTIRVMTH